CFTLTPNPGPDDTEQCTNTPSWSGLTVGSYEITETTTPAGYDPIDPINFIVSLDCSAETPPPVCVEASSDPASFDLGTFEDPLQPGALQVLKQLGTDEGPVAWPDDAPSVTFYICSTGADSTEL